MSEKNIRIELSLEAWERLKILQRLVQRRLGVKKISQSDTIAHLLRDRLEQEQQASK